jgi:hypothetical protein
VAIGYQSIQINKPVTCENTLLIFQALLEQAGEKPIWVGKGDGADTSRTVVLANEKYGKQSEYGEGN